MFRARRLRFFDNFVKNKKEEINGSNSGNPQQLQKKAPQGCSFVTGGENRDYFACASFTALIGKADRHPFVCLSLVVEPFFPGSELQQSSAVIKKHHKGAFFVTGG